MKTLSALKSAFLASEAAEQEVDLDTTPIMNVLIILIPFLASMAVYIHLSVLNMSLPPNVGAGMDASAGRPKLKLTVVVHTGWIGVTYGEKMLDSLSVAGTGAYPLDTLSALLVLRRGEADVKDEIIIAVTDPVRFEHVVDVMDVCRSAGFTRPGLASATENPQEGK
jgi:biopolymer transport protein ExbD